ncbi:MAG: glycosyltransferase [Flavobacteriales bacterium]|nr:glycosyltransferase [Flavobacteriales bacterium]
MKILFIIPSITNYYTFLEDIARELQERGNEVFLASSTKHISQIDCYDREVFGELVEVDFPRGFEWNKHLSSAKRLREIVNEIKPDLINVHFSAAMFTTAIAKEPSWPRTVAMIHGLAYPILKGWRKLAIGSAERWAAGKMDQIILLNESDRQVLSGHVDSSRIKVLESFGLGCDLEKFNLDVIPQEEQIRYHRRLGVRDGDFVFIFVGRQVDFKGFDKLIRAFLQLYEDHKNLKLILVGAKDRIHPTNLTPEEEEQMRRCPGIVNVGWKENVYHYLCVADVNVFPSEREGMPVNLMESLAMGVPVITTDSRGCNEVVEHGLNGLVMKANTVEEIRDNMDRLYQEPDLLNKLKQGALDNRHHFDRTRFIEEMLEIFESDLATSPSS